MSLVLNSLKVSRPTVICRRLKDFYYYFRHHRIEFQMSKANVWRNLVRCLRLTLNAPTRTNSCKTPHANQIHTTKPVEVHHDGRRFALK